MATKSKDRIAPALAARFAWTLVRPHDTPDLDAAVEAEAPDPADDERTDEAVARMKALESDRAAAHAECDRLAGAVDRTWRMRDPAQQAQATARLVDLASSLGVRVAAMEAHPQQGVRLVRLAAKHHAKLSPERVEALLGAMIWLDYDHLELAGLMLDLCAHDAGAIGEMLTTHLAMSSRAFSPARLGPALSARLVAFLAHKNLTWEQRERALSFLEFAPSREAAGALRALIRAPHLGVRARAMRCLLAIEPSPLTADDAAFLLDDLVEHPLPEPFRGDLHESAYEYVRAVESAVVALRPAGGDAALARLVDSRYGNFTTWGISDVGWCLRVMAAAYPEASLPLLDRWLTRSFAYERRAALEGIQRLPDDLARPRLIAAAADGCPDVALRAREAWLARAAAPMPLDPMAGVAAELLDAPPSRAMRDRLLVLRGRSLEARQAMAEVLLAEAPSREALALLVFALADDALWQDRARPALPDRPDAWAFVLVSRFGEAGARAVAALAGRHATDSYNHWLVAACALVDRKELDRALLEPVRGAAARVVADGSLRWVGRDALRFLNETSVPASLRDRLWEIVTTPQHPRVPVYAAMEALAKLPPDAELDARVAERVEGCVAERDAARFASFARLGIERGVAPVVARALALFEAPDGLAATFDDAVRALTSPARALRDRGILSQRRVLDALSPEAPSPDARRAAMRFGVASNLIGPTFTPPQLRLLARQADARRAASPEVAAQAHLKLLRRESVAWKPRGLARVFAGATDAQRATLVRIMAYLGHPPGPLWPLIASMFASTDPDVVEALRSLLTGERSPAWARRLRSVDPARVASPSLAAALRGFLTPTPERRWWQDETKPRA